MLRTREIWNAADTISVIIQFVFLLLCVGFAFFLIWFNLVHVKGLSKEKNDSLVLWWDHYSISCLTEIEEETWRDYWKEKAMEDSYKAQDWFVGNLT